MQHHTFAQSLWLFENDTLKAMLSEAVDFLNGAEGEGDVRAQVALFRDDIINQLRLRGVFVDDAGGLAWEPA